MEGVTDKKFLLIRSTVRGLYDMQNLRISIGNRVVANFRSKLGLKIGEKDDAKKKKLIKKVVGDYELLTEGLADLPTPSRFKPGDIIDDYTELVLVHHFVLLRRQEQSAMSRLPYVLDPIPIYHWLIAQPGVGPQMAGVIISEINIEKATNPSSLWKYCGLDVHEDGTARSRRKEHQVEREYIDRHGEVKKKMGLTYKPWLKAKLLKVLGASLLRATGKNRSKPHKYSEIYDNYRHRLENHPKHKDKTDGHKHAMANRYMVKEFMKDLYVAWRQIEGLPVSEEYSVAKLGIVHSKKSKSVKKGKPHDQAPL